MTAPRIVTTPDGAALVLSRSQTLRCMQVEAGGRCPFCERPIRPVPRKRYPTTCLRPECRREHRVLLMRDWRRRQTAGRE